MADIVARNAGFAIIEMFFDDDDDEILGMRHFINNIIAWKRVYVPRTVDFVERTVRDFTDLDFKMHYRISYDTFTLILDGIGADLNRLHGGGISRHTPEKQILIFLSYMANKESMRQLGLYFGVGTSTVHGILRTVCSHFNRRFSRIMRWPSEAEQQEKERDVHMVCGLRGIVGVLDGSHIRLAHKLNSDNDYINRKGYPSIQLQIVCDHKTVIRNINVGWPGCTHDARVFRNSSLIDILDTNQLLQRGYIIADSAYPLRNDLITPFKDNGRLNPNQRRFNRVLSSARQIVEICIGHMKGRFRRLQELTLLDPNETVNSIVSGCILSNMCILQGDDIGEYIENAFDNHPNNYQNIFADAHDGVQRRNELVNELP